MPVTRSLSLRRLATGVAAAAVVLAAVGADASPRQHQKPADFAAAKDTYDAEEEAAFLAQIKRDKSRIHSGGAPMIQIDGGSTNNNNGASAAASIQLQNQNHQHQQQVAYDGSSSVTTPTVGGIPTECEQYLYAPQCVADTRCGWCCNATAVQTVFPSYYMINATAEGMRRGMTMMMSDDGSNTSTNGNGNGKLATPAKIGLNCIDLTKFPAAYTQCGFYDYSDLSGSALMMTNHMLPNVTTVAPTTTTTFLTTTTTAPDVVTSTTIAPPTTTTAPNPMNYEPSCSINVCNAITRSKFGDSTCQRCVGSGSCYYCLSLRKCVGGRQYCPGGAIVNSCEAPDTSDSTPFFGLSMATTAVIFVALGVVSMGSCGCLVVFVKLRRARIERRIEAERARRHAAATGNATAAANAAAATPAPGTTATTNTAPTTGATTTQTAPAPTTTTTTTTSAAVPDLAAAALASARAAAAQNNTSDTNAVTSRETEGADKKKATSGDGTAAAASASEKDDDEEEEGDMCALCYDRPPNIAFLPCYHAYYCQECCEKIRPAGGKYACPCCRQPVAAMVNYKQKRPMQF